MVVVAMDVVGDEQTELLMSWEKGGGLMLRGSENDQPPSDRRRAARMASPGMWANKVRQLTDAVRKC